MDTFGKIMNFVPIVGVYKGIGHFIVGDKEGEVQALKDSVKIGAVAVTVIGGAVGVMVITSGDGKFNAKERADAAKGIGQIVSDIWNW